MSALLKIDQIGLTAGVAGRARTDGKSDGSRVTLTNTGSGGSTVMRLVWTPPEDTTASASLTVTGDPKVWTFDPTPNAVGSYLVELVQNEGSSSEVVERRVFSVRTWHGLVIPAFNERGDDRASLVLAGSDQVQASNNNATDYPDAALNARPWASWWRALREMFGALDRFAEVVCVADFMTPAERIAAFTGSWAVDHQPAIQRAIDFALYNGGTGFSTGRKVYLGPYMFRTDRTIHVGYGDNDFRGVELVGAGKREGGTFEGGACGTVIRTFFNQGLGIAIQGGRSTVVRGLTLIGQNGDHCFNVGFGAASMAHLAASGWVDPTFPAASSDRYCPYAGIGIDPYTGVEPSPHYPDVEFPSYLGEVDQYEKGTSRDVSIEDVRIAGYVAGVVQHPGQADGNGDYTRLSRVSVWYCAYGFSWGNSQARVNEMDHCTTTFVHTAIASSVHGLQVGNPQITVTACAFETGIQIFETMNLGYGVGPAFIGCFAEAMYMLGRCNGVSQNAGSLKFLNCEFGLSWWSRYGVPTWVLEMEGSHQCRFEGVYFYTSGASGVGRGCLNFRCTGSSIDDEPARSLAFEGCQTQADDLGSADLWEKAGYNATLGIMVSQGSTSLDRFSVRTGYLRNLDTGALLGTGVLHTESAIAPRHLCAPVYAKKLKSLIHGGDPGVDVAWQTYGFSITSVTSTVGRVVTLVVDGITTDSLMHLGGDVGDRYVSSATGAVFACKSRTGTTLVLQAMSGFDKDGNLLNGIVAGGILSPVNCRRHALTQVLYGDITAASPTVTNCTRGDGAAPVLADILTADDYLVVSQDVDQVINPFDGSARLVSFDSGARTMTFAGNFNYSQTRRRFAVFVRPAFPNA